MKSISNLASEPAGLPLVADDVVEFHAARMLLLILHCGTSKRIDGLTKMAKLDFFVRYPQFFDVIRKRLGEKGTVSESGIESSMVRYHYGPWDKRYYHILPLLESKGLLTTTKVGNQFRFQLTDLGVQVGKRLSESPEFDPIVAHMKAVKESLGQRSGNTLKKLIYQVFEDEVAARAMGETIRPNQVS